MENLKLSLKGSILTIEVDLSKRLGKSSSGKTTLVATSKGNQPIPGYEKVFAGINIYTKGD